MSQETIFVDGIRFFKPRDGAPDYVIGSLKVSVDEFSAWVASNEGHLSDYQGKRQLALKVMISKTGNPYLSVDTYTGSQQSTQTIPDKPTQVPEEVDDLPF